MMRPLFIGMLLGIVFLASLTIAYQRGKYKSMKYRACELERVVAALHSAIEDGRQDYNEG